MRPEHPTLAQVRQLRALWAQSIPCEWEDANGHVNIQYYMTLCERAGWEWTADIGIDERYFRDRRLGVFDLEHHIYYLREVHVGDEVSVHSRLLGRTEKRFHGIFYILNSTHDVLASSLEYVTSGANLESRRTAPFPDDVAMRLDRLIAQHRALPWSAHQCGIMSA